MIENVSTQLTVFHCFAHCLLPGRAFASLYALLFLEKEAEIGGRVLVPVMFSQTDMMLLVFFSNGSLFSEENKSRNEPRHEISNNVVCATSKGSDQPAHTHSLIRAFAIRLKIL